MERNQSTGLNFNPADCTILVVDDSENVVELVVALLSVQQYKVISRNSGAETLELLKSSLPDLIITDLMMPDMDGFDLISSIRQTYSRFIPIIMFTASNNDNDRVKALNSGVDDFLTKPVSRHELQARVRNLLRLKKSLDSLNASLSERDRLLNEVTSRYLELEASQGSANVQQPVETMLTTIKAIYTQLQQPVQSAQAYIELASQNYISPGRELELAKFELERITKTLLGLEQVVKTGRMV
jgi:DNA-binding response OmpR family regulator